MLFCIQCVFFISKLVYKECPYYPQVFLLFSSLFVPLKCLKSQLIKRKRTWKNVFVELVYLELAFGPSSLC